jgi:hypothetical protein
MRIENFSDKEEFGRKGLFGVDSTLIQGINEENTMLFPE